MGKGQDLQAGVALTLIIQKTFLRRKCVDLVLGITLDLTRKEAKSS